ncbi:putative clathrin assembly protein At1g25240 [Impatiens glandulifera]|uniref:putative clathrin assembly protein At1g25240 n=1 Tax=Impatiens glandulifera TaxID=253017 RepID=UPI001FB09ED6|nr:putative clathrin assembly protein At1g25240 [Impatiens glandulifera]
MKLWKRASRAIKDQNSIIIAKFTPRSSLRNPAIESAVIKATSHNEFHIDYRNSDRVFRWIRISPGSHLRPFAWALCIRMEKTRDWVVALKGLILMHGVMCCRVPIVQKIGRLPFDLSTFCDEHLSPDEARPYNIFVRDYYAFLDQKSAFFFSFINDEANERTKERKVMFELIRLQKLQILLDMLLQIKPESVQYVRVLILEAMDCVIIEIFDIYSKICTGIAKVLPTIDITNRSECLISLKLLQKATEQGQNLTNYFDFCRKIGVMNASEKPQIPVIPANEIRELERVVNGYNAELTTFKKEEKAIVMSKKRTVSDFYTIITDEWEVFDEEDDDHKNGGADNQLAIIEACGANPNGKKYEELPDLISFL